MLGTGLGTGGSGVPASQTASSHDCSALASASRTSVRRARVSTVCACERVGSRGSATPGRGRRAGKAAVSQAFTIIACDPER